MKQWKPGLLLGDSSVLERTVETAAIAGGGIIVVGGERFQDLQELLADMQPRKQQGAGEPVRQEDGTAGIWLVRNNNPELGMLSSVQAGVREVRAARYFIALGDMPFVQRKTYLKLMEEASGRPCQLRDVLIPRCNGKDGHPVLLSQEHTEAVLSADSRSSSLRDVLAPFPKRFVTVEDKGIAIDLDTPEDYRRMCGTTLP